MAQRSRQPNLRSRIRSGRPLSAIDDRGQRTLLLAMRLLFLVLLATVTLLPYVGNITAADEDVAFRDYAWTLLATFGFGTLILLIDAATPNKRLASVFGVYLGVVAGLVGALAIGALLDLIAESWDLKTSRWAANITLIKLAIGITLCYLAVSIVLTTKDDFRLVIPYVEFAKQVRGVQPLLVDTSVLIDGRIDRFGETGFLDAPLIVPKFVIDELQALADSQDRLKRSRGRRGLDLVSRLQQNPFIDLTIDDADVPGQAVDRMLIRMAEEQHLRIATTDYNLNKVAKLHDVPVLNVNDLANALRPEITPGQTLSLEIVKRGENPDQGVGFLADGTMVVVEHAASRIGARVECTVTNALQTSAGRMVFARTDDGPVSPGAGETEPMDAPPTREPKEAAPASENDGEPPASADGDGDRIQTMGESATRQPRSTDRPSRRPDAPSRRNPRR
jgi:uncharacterized protein YacL